MQSLWRNRLFSVGGEIFSNKMKEWEILFSDLCVCVLTNVWRLLYDGISVWDLTNLPAFLIYNCIIWRSYYNRFYVIFGGMKIDSRKIRLVCDRFSECKHGYYRQVPLRFKVCGFVPSAVNLGKIFTETGWQTDLNRYLRYCKQTVYTFCRVLNWITCYMSCPWFLNLKFGMVF